MARRKDFTDVSPYDPDWRQLFQDCENDLHIMFQPDLGVPKRPAKGWIVEGLLPRGYLALLAGKPKAGKTNLVATLAHAVSQGIPFAGMPTVQAPVLYIAAEESEEEWNLSVWPHLPQGREGLWVGHSGRFRADHEPDLWGLRRVVDHYKAGLVVVDPLLAAVAYGDFARASQARTALTGLKSLCMDKGVAAIVVHHAKESRGLARRVAENPQLAATASLNVVLNHRPDRGRRLVTLALSGRGPWANRTLRLLSKGPCAYESAVLSTTGRETR